MNVNAVEHEEFYSAPDLPEWVRAGNNRTKIKLEKSNLFDSQRLKHLVCCNRVTVTKGEYHRHPSIIFLYNNVYCPWRSLKVNNCCCSRYSRPPPSILPSSVWLESHWTSPWSCSSSATKMYRVMTCDVREENINPIFLVTNRFQLFTPQPRRDWAGCILYWDSSGRRCLLPAGMEDGALDLSDCGLLSHSPRLVMFKLINYCIICIICIINLKLSWTIHGSSYSLLCIKGKRFHWKKIFFF